MSSADGIMLDKFMRHLGINLPNATISLNYSATILLMNLMPPWLRRHYHTANCGKIGPEQPEVVKPTGTAAAKPSTSSIRVLGAGDMLTSLAQCCNPVPGDEIIGFVTRTRVSVFTAKTVLILLMRRERTAY